MAVSVRVQLLVDLECGRCDQRSGMLPRIEIGDDAVAFDAHEVRCGSSAG